MRWMGILLMATNLVVAAYWWLAIRREWMEALRTKGTADTLVMALDISILLAFGAIGFLGHTIASFPEHRSWKRAILATFGAMAWGFLAGSLYAMLIVP